MEAGRPADRNPLLLMSMAHKSIHTFKLRNQTSELDSLCRHLETFAQKVGVSKKVIFQINLALDELFTNIVQYGFDDAEKHWISFDLSHDSGVITVRIEDNGVAFNPLELDSPAPPGSVEKCPVGGLGIHLVKKLMDEIDYQRRRDKNIILLKKFIDEPS